jgi:hypothetical protein
MRRLRSWEWLQSAYAVAFVKGDVFDAHSSVIVVALGSLSSVRFWMVRDFGYWNADR